MGYFTKAQVEQKIQKIIDALDAVMAGQSYTMDSGQGRVTVTRANLTELQKQLDYWLDKYEELDDDSGSIVSVEVVRRGTS